MKLLLILIGCCSFITSLGQSVGIGTPTPNASAQLDVTATNKGILIPRISLVSPSDVVTINTPATGLLVYNSNSNLVQMPDGLGFYFWDGVKWIKMLTTGSSSGSGWLTTGNAGTSGTNFLG